MLAQHSLPNDLAKKAGMRCFTERLAPVPSCYEAAVRIHHGRKYR